MIKIQKKVISIYVLPMILLDLKNYMNLNF